jgi:hypothetical protein
MEYDAELRDAKIFTVGNSARLSGIVYRDTRERFNDGERITTSAVLRSEGRVYITLNSRYLVTFSARC